VLIFASIGIGAVWAAGTTRSACDANDGFLEIVLTVVAYREGWQAVLFLLIFLAIWQLASIGPAGDF
jgi:hypothetical protein